MNIKNNEIVSIIVPVLNEEDNIQTFVDEVNEVLGDISFEIIFCCDPSTDKTEEILEDLAKRNPDKIKKVLYFQEILDKILQFWLGYPTHKVLQQ